MPRNDRSDSLSIRGQDDPRRPLRAMQQETERELGWSEAGDTGGVEHQSPADREGTARDGRPEERATARGPGPRIEGEGLGTPGSGSDGG